MTSPRTSRKLLQSHSVTFSPVMLPHPPTASLSPPPARLIPKPHFHFNSSIVLSLLLLLSVIFSVGFISIYLRQHSGNSSPVATLRRRRQRVRGLRQYPWIYSPPQGLDPAAVQSLPLVPFPSYGKHAGGDCAICLSEFEEGESVKLIPHCGHVFHPECIDKWLASHVTCPLCRSSGISEVEETRLDAVQGRDGHGASHNPGRLAAEGGDTWGEVGAAGVRRVCSCSSLSDPVVALQRSSSLPSLKPEV
ncbi:hypothetical protein NMG60_11033282 [Bertholletia excelsa]